MAAFSSIALAVIGFANVAHADSFLSRPIEFENGVKGYGAVTYDSVVGFRPLELDLYKDPAATGPQPLLVFVHGGSWERNSKRSLGKFDDSPAVFAEIAKRGFVVASVEHRLSGEAAFPAPLHDVQAAIRFLRDNADQWDIDSERVGIWGSSSGGQIAALTAVACENPALLEYRDTTPQTSTCVNAAAIWNGVFDFKGMQPSPEPTLVGNPRSRTLGCDPGYCSNFLLDSAGPQQQIAPNPVPFFLAHSEDDDVVPIAQSREFERGLIAAGGEVETYYVSGLGHGFVGQTNEETTEAQTKLLEQTVQFFEHRLLDASAL